MAVPIPRSHGSALCRLLVERWQNAGVRHRVTLLTLVALKTQQIERVQIDAFDPSHECAFADSASDTIGHQSFEQHCRWRRDHQEAGGQPVALQ